ncbi:MAG: hypothetical protein LBC20_03820 [Planctomycetaceae bacterium]|jgi:hypothetical protein|nr:hypothetical protein [Planctomycetaceae bacterium]
MNFNFFEWVREGVKRSVLLGVSDAVSTMGMPHEEESSKDKILSFLQDSSPTTPIQQRRISSGSPTAASQRKLGRSISDIHAAKDAT